MAKKAVKKSTTRRRRDRKHAVSYTHLAIPTLEQLSKEGEDGRQKINKYTRYITAVSYTHLDVYKRQRYAPCG